MKYNEIIKGSFISRPNRFIAYVSVSGKTEKVHVKNTGRCKELLVKDAEVFLEKSNNRNRSTLYDLVAVNKDGRLINMDSQAPNIAVGEWLRKGELIKNPVSVRPETKYKNSRFDFYVETESDKIFIEVKGVTLERDNVVLFPDAPSERAVKHVKELMEAVSEGYQAYILLAVQMERVDYFTPNMETQPEFGEVLIEAQNAGVKILAYDCMVTFDSMEIHKPVPVKLSVLDRIADPLLKWYDTGHRTLPWREDPAPYHVWISEIMLQQTRVEAVKPYYDRFMKAFPDVKSLSLAEEEPLLKMWEGLGYYNRVRNLNKAARMIMEDFEGDMPSDYDKLLSLPGIGSYTAGAIASIAFGKVVPAVDGNVLRVLSRLKCDERDIMQPSVKKQIEQELIISMSADRPGDFNQALMEIGAMVCVPGGEPKCMICPLKGLCLAHQSGIETKFPVKTKKKNRVIEEKTILIIRDENKAALKKRPDKGLLAGMYEFPSVEGHLTEEEALAYLKGLGFAVLQISPLTQSRHIFTHKEWHMIGYAVRVDELAQKAEQTDMIFVERAQARDQYPIPTAFSAYLHNFLS